ncbi:MAG TPA: hypothetical protein PLR25_10945, partial [Planctomycetaceae bacterium]|nr:hypothetical protein [Planctomycetaceae bacterium]
MTIATVSMPVIGRDFKLLLSFMTLPLHLATSVLADNFASGSHKSRRLPYRRIFSSLLICRKGDLPDFAQPNGHAIDRCQMQYGAFG